MKQPARKRKKLDYPQETEGSRLAAKVRKLGSKLTPEQEAEYFRRGMAKSMAASPKKSLALDTNLLLDLAGEKDLPTSSRRSFPAEAIPCLCRRLLSRN